MPKRHHFSAWFHPTPGLDYLTANPTDVGFLLFHSDGVAADLGAEHALCWWWGDPTAHQCSWCPLFPPLCPFLSPAVMAHHRGGGGTRGHVALAGGVWRPLPKNVSSSPSCSYHPSPGCRYVLAPCQDAVCVFNRLLVPRLTCWPRKIIWFEIIISYWAGFTE